MLKLCGPILQGTCSCYFSLSLHYLLTKNILFHYISYSEPTPDPALLNGVVLETASPTQRQVEVAVPLMAPPTPPPVDLTLKTVDITPIIRNPPTTQPPEPLALPPPPPPVPQVPAVVGEPLVVDPPPPTTRKFSYLFVYVYGILEIP